MPLTSSGNSRHVKQVKYVFFLSTKDHTIREQVPFSQWGHVGISLGIHGPVFGFSPILGPNAKPPYLKEYPAIVREDTILFLRAWQYRHPVHAVTFDIDEARFNAIARNLMRAVRKCQSKTFDKFYALPNPGPPYFDEGRFNCATYMVSLGIPELFKNGFLRARRSYMMTAWKPVVPRLHSMIGNISKEMNTLSNLIVSVDGSENWITDAQQGADRKRLAKL